MSENYRLLCFRKDKHNNLKPGANFPLVCNDCKINKNKIMFLCSSMDFKYQYMVRLIIETFSYTCCCYCELCYPKYSDSDEESNDDNDEESNNDDEEDKKSDKESIYGDKSDVIMEEEQPDLWNKNYSEDYPKCHINEYAAEYIFDPEQVKNKVIKNFSTLNAIHDKINKVKILFDDNSCYIFSVNTNIEGGLDGITEELYIEEII